MKKVLDDDVVILSSSADDGARLLDELSSAAKENKRITVKPRNSTSQPLGRPFEVTLKTESKLVRVLKNIISFGTHGREQDCRVLYLLKIFIDKARQEDKKASGSLNDRRVKLSTFISTQISMDNADKVIKDIDVPVSKIRGHVADSFIQRLGIDKSVVNISKRSGLEVTTATSEAEVQAEIHDDDPDFNGELVD